MCMYYVYVLCIMMCLTITKSFLDLQKLKPEAVVESTTLDLLNLHRWGPMDLYIFKYLFIS